jgi:hypothetical protein
MKTYKNLYPQVSDFDNLYAAWRKTRQGKRYKISTAKQLSGGARQLGEAFIWQK